MERPDKTDLNRDPMTSSIFESNIFLESDSCDPEYSPDKQFLEILCRQLRKSS
jgi:hypothetical protein